MPQSNEDSQPLPVGGVSGVVLAAGESRRFGNTPKQMLEIDDETLVHRVARRAVESSLCEVIVVVGHSADVVSAAVSDLPVRVVENPDYAAGQSSSVKAGLRAVSSSSSAALFIPADQPRLSTELIDSMVVVYRESLKKGDCAAPIVLPSFGGSRGTPVLFDRSLFDCLLQIRGDQGGRQLFAEHEENLICVAVDEESLLLDVDTPEDWEQCLRGRG